MIPPPPPPRSILLVSYLLYPWPPEKELIKKLIIKLRLQNLILKSVISISQNFEISKSNFEFAELNSHSGSSYLLQHQT